MKSVILSRKGFEKNHLAILAPPDEVRLSFAATNLIVLLKQVRQDGGPHTSLGTVQICLHQPSWDASLGMMCIAL